jgi:hypothetical protein
LPDELRWQRYRMDAPLKGGRTTMFAVFNRPIVKAAPTVNDPGIILSFKDWPELVSLSSEGRVRWRRRLDAPVKDMAISADGAVFAALDGGTVVFVPPDGKPSWKYRAGSEVTVLAASGKAGCAAAGVDGGGLLLLGSDGKAVFDTPLASPAVRLFVSQDGSAVMCADSAGGVSLVSREGKVLWRRLFGDGVADMATTGGCTKTVVLSGKVHGLSLDGSERWSAEAPSGCAGVRMSDDGADAYALAPDRMIRFGPSGKKIWERAADCRPGAASVLAGMKMLLLPSSAGTSIMDRWGNFALECPLAAGDGEGTTSSFFDGARILFQIGDAGQSSRILLADVGPALVDYLLRAARLFGDECLRIGQPSPFGDNHFLEATRAARSGDYPRALENARFSYRYYEETLSSIQHDTERIVDAESLAAVKMTARVELEEPMARRPRLYQAKCTCGAINDVFTPEVPLLVRCTYCGKAGLVEKAPGGK